VFEIFQNFQTFNQFLNCSFKNFDNIFSNVYYITSVEMEPGNARGKQALNDLYEVKEKTIQVNFQKNNHGKKNKK